MYLDMGFVNGVSKVCINIVICETLKAACSHMEITTFEADPGEAVDGSFVNVYLEMLSFQNCLRYLIFGKHVNSFFFNLSIGSKVVAK